MFPLGPNIDVSSSAILVAQPRDRFQDRLNIPNTRDHGRLRRSCIRFVKPNLEQFDTHRSDLPLDGFKGGLTTGVRWFKPILGVDIHTAQRSPTNKGEWRGPAGTPKLQFCAEFWGLPRYALTRRD